MLYRPCPVASQAKTRAAKRSSAEPELPAGRERQQETIAAGAVTAAAFEVEGYVPRLPLHGSECDRPPAEGGARGSASKAITRFVALDDPRSRRRAHRQRTAAIASAVALITGDRSVKAVDYGGRSVFAGKTAPPAACANWSSAILPRPESSSASRDRAVPESGQSPKSDAVAFKRRYRSSTVPLASSRS